MIEIRCADRWQAYRRLVELDLDCQCCGYRPLLVRVDTPCHVMQVWSTTQWLCQERQELTLRLARCWQLPAHRLPYKEGKSPS